MDDGNQQVTGQCGNTQYKALQPTANPLRGLLAAVPARRGCRRSSDARKSPEPVVCRRIMILAGSGSSGYCLRLTGCTYGLAVASEEWVWTSQYSSGGGNLALQPGMLHFASDAV